MTAAGERELGELLARARGEGGVLGVILLGSRAWGHGVDERSDYDVVVVTTDEAARSRFAAEVPFRRGDPVEVVTDTVEGLRAHAAPGSASEWAAPAYARAAFDGYVNAYHRSALNRMVGLTTAARLDAAESLAAFPAFVFLVEGRVRPFNKHLEHELTVRPLAEPAWAVEAFLRRLERILDGYLQEQQAQFRDAERVAHSAGLGDAVDAWEPDVGWLRGQRPYHER